MIRKIKHAKLTVQKWDRTEEQIDMPEVDLQALLDAQRTYFKHRTDENLQNVGRELNNLTDKVERHFK